MKGLLLAALLVFSLGCKTPVEEPVNPTKPQMQTRTETGANIVACKVDGQVHIYRGKATWNDPNGVDFVRFASNPKHIFLWATQSGYGDDITIRIFTFP